ncbi:MAG: asparagine synthase-related protein [Bradymonadaceae bacterium]
MLERESSQDEVFSSTSNHLQVQIALRDGGPYNCSFASENSITAAVIGHWHPRVPEAHQDAPWDSSAARALLVLWLNEGADGLTRVRGPLAGVIWNQRTSKLTAFRDHFGVHPLVYHQDVRKNSLLVSTDPQWLVEMQGAGPSPNRSRVLSFLSGTDDNGTDDFLEGHCRVRPAECVESNGMGLSVRRYRYWHSQGQPAKLYQQYPEVELRHCLDQALGSATGPSHVFEMSGGLDSPALVALGTNRFGRSPLAISMVTSKHPRTDESPMLNLLEAYGGIDLHRFDISSEWPLKDPGLFDISWGGGPHFHPGEQYKDAFYAWAREQWGNVDIISGAGADQALHCPRRLLIEELVNDFPRSFRSASQLGVTQQEICRHILRPTLAGRVYRSLKKHYRHWVSDELMPWRNAENWIIASERTVHSDPVTPPRDPNSFRLGHLRGWRWELACRAGSRTSSRTGLRRIYPYLDVDLWELLSSLNASNLWAGGRSKGLLRAAMSSCLPREHVMQRKKGAFDSIVETAIAVQEFDFVTELFCGSHLADMGLIDEAAFKAIHSAYRYAYLNKNRPDYLGSFPIWSTIATELWLRALKKESSRQVRRRQKVFDKG